MDRMRRGRRIRIRLNKMASPVSIQAAFKSAISFSFAIQEEGFMGTPTNNNEHIHNSACLPYISICSYLHLQETSMWFSRSFCSSSTPLGRSAVAPTLVVAHDGRCYVVSAWDWRLETISPWSMEIVHLV